MATALITLEDGTEATITLPDALAINAQQYLTALAELKEAQAAYSSINALHAEADARVANAKNALDAIALAIGA